VLATLLEHPGKKVTREELRSKLWPEDTFVDFDHSLNAAIKRLRDESRGRPKKDRPRITATTGEYSGPRD
jgi:DNA-binding response OmpR family regulator